LPEVEEPVRVVATQEDAEDVADAAVEMEGSVEVVFAQSMEWVVVWLGTAVAKVDGIVVFPGTM